MSLSIDLTGIMNTAFQWVNSLMPIYSVPLGITVGLALVGTIAGLLTKAFRGGVR
jgi:hypothetical protein